MIYYVIVPTDEVSQTLLNASTTHDLEDTRHSLDASLCVLKFESTESAQYFIDREWYNYEEISEIMLDEDWNPDA
jgi:hypothetical protein